jgi:nucleoid DNA-binding protein
MDLMAEEILTGELSLPDFGRFEVRWTKPMIGRNPLIPDVEIVIPPRPKVVFRPSKEFRDRAIKTLAVGGRKK